MDKPKEHNDQSYGVLPFRRKGSHWETLLVLHQAGHWAFPKGHPEKGETPFDCACRELEEETALKVIQLLSPERLSENYSFHFKGRKILKQVGYYIAEVQGSPQPQLEEVEECRWFSLDAASKQLTFPQAQDLLAKAIQILP